MYDIVYAKYASQSDTLKTFSAENIGGIIGVNNTRATIYLHLTHQKLFLLKNGVRNLRNCRNNEKNFKSKIHEYADARVGEGGAILY